MQKSRDLRAIIAENLRFFMDREDSLYRNANALSIAAKMSANSVRNILDPDRRPTTTEKGEGYPLLDTLAAIAGALGVQVWELLHPDIQRSMRERDLYRTVESGFPKQDRSPPPGGC